MNQTKHRGYCPEKNKTVYKAITLLFFIVCFSPYSFAQKNPAITGVMQAGSITTLTNTRFDGQLITKKLAKKIAGNQNLLFWGDCSLESTGKGHFKSISLRNQKDYSVNKAKKETIACLYLILGDELNFREFYIRDIPCSTQSPLCRNGYTISTKIRHLITEGAREDDFQLVVDSGYFLNPNLVRKGQLLSNSSTITIQSTAMKKLGSINSSYWWSGTSMGYQIQGFDNKGNPSGKPEIGMRIAQSSDSTSSSSSSSSVCTTLNSFIEGTGNAAGILAGGMVTAQGIGAGAVLGGFVGSIGGPEASAAGVAVGGTAGGAMGAAQGTVIHTVYSTAGSLIGDGAEALCNKLKKPKVHNTPNQPPIVPRVPIGPINTEVSNTCLVCLQVESQSIEIGLYPTGDDNYDSVYAEETVCTDWKFAQGKDSNGDGFCD